VPDGRYLIRVYGPTDDVLDEFRATGYEVAVFEHPTVTPPDPDRPQFSGGVVPVGFGAQVAP
jgi:hypothetical protein